MPERRLPPTETSSPLCLRALNTAIGRTPLWITASALMSLMALVVTLPWFSWFQDAMDHRYAPGALLVGLDETFRYDHSASRAVLEESTRATGAVMALVAMLVGVFTAGGWLQVCMERTEGHSLRRFFFGGSRYFFRFLRVLVVTILSLSLLSFVVYGQPWDLLVNELWLGLTDGNLEQLSSELEARRIVFLQDGLYFAGVALLLAWGDYTRTRLALHDTKSAVWAGLCTWALLIMHPLRTLRPLLLLWVIEAAMLSAAWQFSMRIESRLGPESGGAAILLLILLGQVGLCWRTIVRGARYAATTEVSHYYVRPLPRPDPWKEVKVTTVGGPGGPQYPIGDVDQFGV